MGGVSIFPMKLGYYSKNLIFINVVPEVQNQAIWTFLLYGIIIRGCWGSRLDLEMAEEWGKIPCLVSSSTSKNKDQKSRP